MINTLASINQLSHAHICFGVYVGQALIYVGACPLHRALELHELGRNTVFRKTVTRDTPLQIVEMSRHGTADAAQQAASDIIAALPTEPPCNAPGAAPKQRKGVRVKRLDTGDTFENAAQAAHAAGISPQAMSNHLNGRPGYTSVRGMTFARVEND